MAMSDTEYAAKIENDLKELDETGISEITSKSQFFSSNSSKLGTLDSFAVERPNLGLGSIGKSNF